MMSLCTEVVAWWKWTCSSSLEKFHQSLGIMSYIVCSFLLMCVYVCNVLWPAIGHFSICAMHHHHPCLAISQTMIIGNSFVVGEKVVEFSRRPRTTCSGSWFCRSNVLPIKAKIILSARTTSITRHKGTQRWRTNPQSGYWVKECMDLGSKLLFQLTFVGIRFFFFFICSAFSWLTLQPFFHAPSNNEHISSRHCRNSVRYVSTCA